MKKIFIGLMGVENDGKTLVTPSGKSLFAVPSFLAWRIQRVQHFIARLTHVLILFCCFALVSGCKSYTSVVSYVQKNCIATKSTANGETTVTYECGELYNTDAVKDKCSSIQICFDGAKAKLSGKATCNDSLIDIERLIKLAINRK